MWRGVGATLCAVRGAWLERKLRRTHVWGWGECVGNIQATDCGLRVRGLVWELCPRRGETDTRKLWSPVQKSACPMCVRERLCVCVWL